MTAFHVSIQRCDNWDPMIEELKWKQSEDKQRDKQGPDLLYLVILLLNGFSF